MITDFGVVVRIRANMYKILTIWKLPFWLWFVFAIFVVAAKNYGQVYDSKNKQNHTTKQKQKKPLKCMAFICVLLFFLSLKLINIFSIPNSLVIIYNYCIALQPTSKFL